MLVGGAMVNTLAFSGSNYLFSMLRSSDLNEERKCHDLAVGKLQAARAKWSRKRTERLDWISEDLRHQGHAAQTEQQAKDWLKKQAIWQIYLPAPRHIPRPKFDVAVPNEVDQAGLLFLPH